jgi:hypothetical protein
MPLEDQNLLKVIEELDPENSLGALLVVQMGTTPQEVQLILETTRYDEGKEALQRGDSYIVRCISVQEHRVSVGLFRKMVYTEDHPLLWNHNHMYRQVYFRGRPDHVEDLMLELNQLYGEHYGAFRSLASDVNHAMPLGTLLTSGDGMLGEMPAPMAEKVKRLLERHGFKVCFITSDMEPPEIQYSLLVMDDSFFIAHMFSADPVQARPNNLTAD